MPRVSVGTAQKIYRECEEEIQKEERALSNKLWLDMKHKDLCFKDVADMTGMTRQTVSNVINKPFHCTYRNLFLVMYVLKK